MVRSIHRIAICVLGLALGVACGNDLLSIATPKATDAGSSVDHPTTQRSVRLDAALPSLGGLDGGGALRGTLPCSASRDCASDPSGRQLCDGLSHRCVECVADADCGGGKLCVQRTCVASSGCSNSLDCPLGAVCDQDASRCVECVSAADCNPGSVCAQQHCQPSCNSDKDCTPLGRLCDKAAGNCVEPGSTVAGVDAGRTAADAQVSCSTGEISVSRVVPTVMLVVDGSASMGDVYPDQPDAGTTFPPADAGLENSRWHAVREALIAPGVGVVAKLEGMVKFGLAVFGTTPQCPFPLAMINPALNNYAAITAGLPQAPPGQFTPTGPALSQIADLLDTVRPIVVLATDGDPNDCGTDPLALPMTNYPPSIDAALKLQGKGQRMYVISMGHDARAAHLQEMANIGAGLARNASPGAPVYYPDDPAALASTFAALIDQQLPCALELNGTVRPGSECKGDVTLNGMRLECNGADGWKLTDASHIELSGIACAQFKASATASVAARFPCDMLP